MASFQSASFMRRMMRPSSMRTGARRLQHDDLAAQLALVFLELAGVGRPHVNDV